MDNARFQQNTNRVYERKLQYREQILEMQRCLQMEKRTTRLLTEMMQKKAGQRTELEVFLRHAVEDVQMELSRQQNGLPKMPPVGVSAAGTVHAMTAADR